jgi:chemotaxis protein MotB
MVAEVTKIVTNDIAIEAHISAYSGPLRENPAWNLSVDRADSVRRFLNTDPNMERRIARVTGHADKEPVTSDPTAPRNNRIEVILLRSDL